MKYLEYLKEKFDIRYVEYEVFQMVLEKSYTVKVNDYEYKEYTFESIIHIIREDFRHKRYSIYADQISFSVYKPEHCLYGIVLDNITNKELYYMLYILYARFNWKFKKKDIDDFIK